MMFFAFLSVCSLCSAQDDPTGIKIKGYAAPSATATADSYDTQFLHFIRFPAEERQWVIMKNDTAYYRDKAVGGRIFINGATDGDTWSAIATRADGQATISWGDPALRYYDEYNGQQMCFVTSQWVQCGGKLMFMEFTWDSQCDDTCVPNAPWTMRFIHNGFAFREGQFTVLPEINPEKLLPLHSQLTYNTADDYYDNVCRPNKAECVKDHSCDKPCTGLPEADEVPQTIAVEGCYLTAATQILNYHGVSVTPRELNDYLKGKLNGYSASDGAVNPYAVADYAKSQNVGLTYIGRVEKNQYTDKELEAVICLYGPQMVGVRNDQHWVIATGRDANKTTWKIVNPGGGVATTTAEKGWSLGGIRAFIGPEYIVPDKSGIIFRFHSPGELLVENPEALKTGYNPTTGIFYSEIGKSTYGTYSIGDQDADDRAPITKELEIMQPIAGDYKLYVIGTDTGTYSLEILTADPNGSSSVKSLSDISISKDEVHVYGFFYPKTVGGNIEIGYAGGGQRPRDVNKFLSYINPSQAHTTLPAGATTYSMIIMYGETLISSSFTAELNGVNVTNLFHPVPGGTEVVTLNLSQGRNKLVLSSKANLTNRIAEDSDSLVFLVP